VKEQGHRRSEAGCVEECGWEGGRTGGGWGYQRQGQMICHHTGGGEEGRGGAGARGAVEREGEGGASGQGTWCLKAAATRPEAGRPSQASP
jgi:hypothetical protein